MNPSDRGWYICVVDGSEVIKSCYWNGNGWTASTIENEGVIIYKPSVIYWY